MLSNRLKNEELGLKVEGREIIDMKYLIIEKNTLELENINSKTASSLKYQILSINYSWSEA